jgi:hypothetical protein
MADELLERLKGNKSRYLGLDMLYIGGQSMVDILGGAVKASDINPEVVNAYKLQYPDLAAHKDFVSEVQSLKGDPEAMRGLVSGVKGKLFEVKYCDYLNDGHLPIGDHAELASSANQPGYDLVIKNSHGHVDEEVQAKAYETLSGVKEHLDKYPQYDVVVVPHDQVPDALRDHLHAQIQDGHFTNAQLNGETHGALDTVTQASHLHLPLVGYGLLAGEALILFFSRKPAPASHLATRAAKITASSLAGQLAAMLTHLNWAALPASLTARVLMDKFGANQRHVDSLNMEMKGNR